MARRFYREAGERYRRAILWDVEPASRGEWLAAAAPRASEIYAGYLDNKPLSLILVQALAKNAKTGNAHMFFTGNHQGCAHAMIEPFRRQTGMLKLVAIVPRPFFFVRKFARECGFREIARLPDACHMARTGKNQDGILLEWDIFSKEKR